MSSVDELSLSEIHKYLKDKSASDKIIIFDEIDSTNNEAKRRILNNTLDKNIIISNSQFAGRGRMGRNFYSPGNTGIYISFILNCHDIEFDIELVTTMTCVAVSKAISKVVGTVPQIKWVNDLYLQEKKVCGILCEAVNDTKRGNLKAIIIGIGVNCSTVFEGELSQIAGSLFKDNQYIRNQLIGEIINEIDAMVREDVSESYLKYYRHNSMIIGRKVFIVGEEEKTYIADNIGSMGELILKDENEQVRIINSGEVSIRLK